MKMVAINTRISDDQFPVLPKPTYQPGSFDPLEDHRASRPKGSNILHRQLKRLQRQHSIVLSKVEKEEKHERLSRRHEEEENRPKDSYRKFDGRKGHRKVVSKREKSFLSSCTKLPDINNDKEEIFRRHSVASLTSEEREDRSLAHRSVQSKYSDETDDRIGLHHFRNVHSKYSDGSDNKIGNQSFRNVRSKYSDELDDRIRSHRIHNVHPKYNDKRDDHIGKHPLRNVYSKYSDERDDRIGNYRLRTVYSKYSDDTDDRKLHHHRTFSKYESNHQSTAHSSYQTDSADYENKLPDIYPGQNNSLGNCTHQLDNSKRSQLGDARETLHQRNNGLLLQRSEINNESRDYFKLVQQRFGRQQRRRPRNVLLQRAKEKRRQCRNVFLKYSADLEDRQKLRRLGSGLLPPVVVDSHILTHMLSLLDGQKKKVLLDTDFIDDKSSEHSGSFKGKARRSKGSKGKKSLSSSRDDKEYVGNVPVVAMRSGASSPTTLPLIPGTLPLPPIGEASREQTSIPPVVLPPIGTEAVPLVSIQPPTPQHTFLSTHGAQEPSLNTQAEEDPQDQTDGAWGMGDTETLRQRAMEQERRRKEEKLRRKRGEGPTVSGGSYLQSSSESLGAGSTSSIPVARPIRTNWKGSNQSLRSIGSKKADSEGHKSPENEIDDRSGDDGSLKGSVIFGPDGQVISVGGAIQPSPRIEATGMIDQVTDANRIFGKDLASDESDDEPEEWKHSKALRRREVMRREGSVKSQISEEDIVNALTEHAQQVAASVLSAKSETGKDLEADVRQAAEMWMERHPPRQISRSQSIQENHESTVIDEIMEMQKQKRKSAGPTAGEYRELIKDSLTTAMKAQGLNDNIPDDTEITQEVIEALTNGSLTPDDLELVHDSDSGRSVIRSRSQLANAMGGVKQGHIYVAGSKNGKKAPGSIPVDRTSNVDVGEFDVIKYGTASQSGSEKAPSEKAMSEKAISEKAPSERAPSEKAPSEKIGKSQPPSIMGESIVEEPPEVADAEKKSTISFQSEAEPQVDEFKKAVEEIEEQQTKQEPEPPIQEEPKLPDEQRARSRKSNRSLQSRNSFQSHQSRCSHFKSDISKKSDEKSTRSAKSRVSDKKSKVSDTSQKGKSELEKRDEFVVGKVKQTNELEQLYGPVDPPSKEPTQPSEPEEKESTPEMPQKKVEMPRKKADIPPKKPPETPKKKEEPKKIVVNPPQEEEELSTIPEDGKPNFKGELEKLFGKLPANKDKGKPKDKKPKASPPLRKQKEKAKKGKGKAKAKKEEEKEPEPPPKEPTPPPPKEPTPPPPAPEVKPEDAESVRESIVDSYKSEEESDFEFNIVRDSPSPEPIQQSLPSLPSYDDNTETENEDDEEDRGKKQKKQRAKKQKDEAARLRQISNREARAAKRAAQAEKRRQEVDRRRRERDEQAKREKEEWERQELLKQELEEARKRNEENRRRRRELEAEENAQELLEEEKRQQQLLAEQERERRRREEYQRKLEEMKRKQIIEEQKRQEEMMRKMKEEEERRLAEEEMMAKMAEEERIAYEEKKRREEEERKRKEEEERIKREEEAKKAMEEARKLAEEMARRQAELEARLKFNHTIQVESSGMTHSQSMTRAFVFSYYELLSWLGLDIPEFELLKLNQY
ncbi:trichohyalin-like isoform X20 [Pecten maximus]|uniref:trichohyalin-like isoform X20 n=1 Tax=Pecten maximus TaxID=6579 RepID=UPI0014580FAA|nr:trichohyalin-like isoform X20 [Pecten maximus]